MPVTEKEATAVWVERWRTLKAWGAALDADTWKVSIRMRRKGDYSTGRCFFGQRRIVVTASSDIVDSLGTILHEFAHAATPRRADIEHDTHDLPWQRIYAAAVHEVTGVPIATGVEKYTLMDTAACAALRRWWKTSGHEFAWNLVKHARP